MRLTLCVTAETHGYTAAQGAVHYELERKHVWREVPFDGTGDEGAEMLGNPFGGHLTNQLVEGGSIIGEEADVTYIALVTGPHAAHVTELAAHHTSSTCTWTATSSRST